MRGEKGKFARDEDTISGHLLRGAPRWALVTESALQFYNKLGGWRGVCRLAQKQGSGRVRQKLRVVIRISAVIR